MTQPTRLFAGGAAMLSLLLSVAACDGAKNDASAPNADDDELDVLQTVTSGTITMTANAPSADLGTAAGGDATVWGSVTFGGSGTAGMGACIMARVEGPINGGTRNECGPIVYETTAPVACTSESDCTSYQVYPGGHAYCTAPDGVGQKYCYVRPGTQAQYCRGTPAGEGLVTAPTTLRIPATGSVPGYPAGYPATDYSYLVGYEHNYYYDCIEYYGMDNQNFTTWVTYACVGPTCTPNSVSRPLEVRSNYDNGVDYGDTANVY